MADTPVRKKYASPDIQDGVGVDSKGGPLIDPTANVIALNEAAVRRQDDLRIASERFTSASLSAMREMAEMRAMYQEKLSEAEAKRIDAIRAVDVNAVGVASERQSQAANVLAAQVAQSADALRTLVNTTATAQAEQQRQSTQQITDRLTAVERSQYEGRGKQLVADPMMAELVAEMKSLRESRSVVTGKSQGSTAMWGYVAGAIGILFGLIGAAVALMKLV